MLKNILNLGNTLNKAEQKEINGGRLRPVGISDGCHIPSLQHCNVNSGNFCSDMDEVCVTSGSRTDGQCMCT